MRTDLPPEIQQSVHDLEPGAILKLFKIELRSGTLFHLSPMKEVVWQGDTYEEVPCGMTDVGREADGKFERPKFSFANPGGVFTPYVQQGYTDGALITRYRVAKADIDADLNNFMSETYRVGRTLALSKTLVSLELRTALDGPHFKFPPRTYRPPEFLHVDL